MTLPSANTSTLFHCPHLHILDLTMKLDNYTNPAWSIIIDDDSSRVRLYLRAYFTILLILLPLVGDYLCGLKTQLMLDRGRSVPVTLMTGWMSAFRVVSCMVQYRWIPGGWLGVIMV